MRIDTAEAIPGARANGVVHVANRPDGSSILYTGDDGQRREGWPNCRYGRVARTGTNRKLRGHPATGGPTGSHRDAGTVIGVPVVNVPAFQAMQRATPYDALSYPDLNRNYPGDWMVG